jgi:hypothetical protein
VVLWMGGGGWRDISGSRGRLRGLDNDDDGEGDEEIIGVEGFHVGRLMVDNEGSVFSSSAAFFLGDSRGEIKSRDISRRI